MCIIRHMYTDMSYYTRIFGTTMSVTPVYYELQNGEQFVYVYADTLVQPNADGVDEEVVQLVRLGIDMVAANPRRFDKNNRSTQRLTIHFRDTLPPVPATVRPITQIPERKVLEQVLGNE